LLPEAEPGEAGINIHPMVWAIKKYWPMALPARQSVGVPPFFCDAVVCLLVRVNDDDHATSIQIHALVLGQAFNDFSAQPEEWKIRCAQIEIKITSSNWAHGGLCPVTMDGNQM
jgi:hypothetical protein